VRGRFTILPAVVEVRPSGVAFRPPIITTPERSAGRAVGIARKASESCSAANKASALNALAMLRGLRRPEKRQQQRK
jgi:hypothetical protein